MEVTAAANQVRVSNTKGIKLFIYSHTDPTFESVSGCTIGPYNFNYPKVRTHFEAAGTISSRRLEH